MKKIRTPRSLSSSTSTLALVTLGIFVPACVTINVYFPEAAVKDLSVQIEEQIEQQAAGGEADSAMMTPTEAAPADHLGLAVLLSYATGAAPAFAQEEKVPAPEITNPAIRKIIDARAARLADINLYKASGVLGEGKDALLVTRALDSVTDLRERATVQRLVKAENADRNQLFQEIAAAKNVDRAQLSRIQATYAETLREKARKGDWIQLPDDSWKRKQ